MLKDERFFWEGISVGWIHRANIFTFTYYCFKKQSYFKMSYLAMVWQLLIVLQFLTFYLTYTTFCKKKYI